MNHPSSTLPRRVLGLMLGVLLFAAAPGLAQLGFKTGYVHPALSVQPTIACAPTWWGPEAVVHPNGDLGLIMQASGFGMPDHWRAARRNAAGVWSTPGVGAPPYFTGGYERCQWTTPPSPIGGRTIVKVGSTYYAAFNGGNADAIIGKIYWATSSDLVTWNVLAVAQDPEVWTPLVEPAYHDCEEGGIAEPMLAFDAADTSAGPDGTFYLLFNAFGTDGHPFGTNNTWAYRFAYDPTAPWGLGGNMRVWLDGVWTPTGGQMVFDYDIAAGESPLPGEPVLEAGAGQNGASLLRFGFGTVRQDPLSGLWLHVWAPTSGAFTGVQTATSLAANQWTASVPIDLTSVTDLYASTFSTQPEFWYGSHGDRTGRWLFVPREAVAGGCSSPYLGVVILPTELCADTQPTIAAVTPSLGPTGGSTAVDIVGSDLDCASSITFGGAQATIVSRAPGLVRVLSPAHTAGAVAVAVTTPGGTATKSGGFTYQQSGDEVLIGEVGTVAVSSSAQTVVLGRVYADPVVFAQPPSYAGADTAVVRLRNVQADRFTLWIDEAPDRDGSHGTETVSYLVLERGSWQLAGGRRLEVGTVTTAATIDNGAGSWATMSFPTLGAVPAVLTQVQTENDPAWVKTRQRNAAAGSFQVALEEAEKVPGDHGTETIGYLAIEPGTGTWSGHPYAAANSPDTVGSGWATVTFAASVGSAPRLVGALATYDGPNAAAVRYRNLTSSSVQLKVEEDTVNDSEVSHTTEVVAYLALGGDGLLAAEPHGGGGGVNPPVITQHPQSQTVAQGATAVFTVAASGQGPLTYQWRRNGAAIANGGHYAGVTTASLTVSNVDATVTGNYSCVVSNAGGGTASGSATLSLAAVDPPTITQHPSNQTVAAGAQATFTVAASGQGPLSYQWYRDGGALANGGQIAGATSASLTVSNVGASVTGVYHAVVSNAGGATPSNTATLALAGGACTPSNTTLCLRNGRFAVELDWYNPAGGSTGSGKVRTFSDESGFFYFFGAANIEVGVKVVGPFGADYWVYYGGATDLEYTLSITDTQTGTSASYLKPAGSLCGGADPTTFDLATAPTEALELALPGVSLDGAVAGTCVTGTANACLLSDRFKVEVKRNGTPQPAVDLTDATGVFTFGSAANAEVFVKMVDGTAFNGKHWLYVGSLTSLSYQVTITDTVSGQVKTWNSAAAYCGVADTQAF